MDNYEFDYDEYIEDIVIDPDELDVEWLKQPELFGKYRKIAVQLRKETSLAEEKVKTIRSELMKEAKEDEPSMTGPLLEAHYRTDKEYKRAKKNLIEAQYLDDLLNAVAISSLYQREKALTHLVRLLGLEYFAGPVAPRDLAEKFNKYARSKVKKEESRGIIREKMKKIKRKKIKKSKRTK